MDSYLLLARIVIAFRVLLFVIFIADIFYFNRTYLSRLFYGNNLILLLIINLINLYFTSYRLSFWIKNLVFTTFFGSSISVYLYSLFIHRIKF